MITQVPTSLTGSVSYTPETVDYVSDTSTLKLIKNKGKDIISRADAQLSSFALGTINSLYYALSNSQGVDEGTSVENLGIINNFVQNYLAPVQVSLFTISLVFYSLGRESFNLIPSVFIPISYLMGAGCSLYAIGDALAHDIGIK